MADRGPGRYCDPTRKGIGRASSTKGRKARLKLRQDSYKPGSQTESKHDRRLPGSMRNR